MRICAVQTKPIKGDIPKNIEIHKKLIELAIANGANIIIFPELSLTGYEPELANALAVSADTSQLNDFQRISDAAHCTIGLGIPVKSDLGISISMILFQPHTARGMYSKKYLHPDEEPFFISGSSSVGLIGAQSNVALAICYELSIPEHSEIAAKNGAEIYLASVAKSAAGVEKAAQTLSDIAKNYSMTVLMSNCVGYCDNFESGGKTSVWTENGALAGQLDDKSEGFLLYDTQTNEAIAHYL
ncbi:carbon-nitrogen hydrolase family protein [Runella aurantiaca]|uniref:Carbon-nitrogen hydrolase family protein n=1 Tax=Runella aurantiaca TaxID=2282308 RepID=A0A369I9S6_9BACT|nr:carbon-nitrogen hydrolase family protein [Runella aurantiaca]RDB05630.1 carbon-nitrogen hydrolase family protein [Runella aurantiaca]